MIFCPRCGTQNKESWESCLNCQRDLVRVRQIEADKRDFNCSSCGQGLVREWNFCPGCGRPVEQPKILPQVKPLQNPSSETPDISATLPLLVEEKTRIAKSKGNLFVAYKKIFVMASLLIIAVAVSLAYISIIGARGIYTAQTAQIIVELNKVKSDLVALTTTFSPQVGQGSGLAELQKIKSRLEELIEKAEKLKPPGELKESYQTLKANLSKYRAIVDKLIKSFELNDASLFSGAKSELEQASRTNLTTPIPSFNTASVAAELNSIKGEVRRIVESYELGSSNSQQAINDLQAVKDKVDQLLEKTSSDDSSASSSDPTISRLIGNLEEYQSIVEKLITSYQNNDTTLFAQALDGLEKAEQTIIE